VPNTLSPIRLALPFSLAVVSLAFPGPRAHAAAPAPEVQLTAFSDRVRVTIADTPFTEYIFDGAKRPYLYPLAMSDGTTLNREFPMKSPPGEDHDHPHHRSLWFAHSSVAGIDFWNEGTAGGDTPKGTIVHEALLQTASGPVGVIRTTNRWLAPDRTLVCTDETTITFRRGPDDSRMIDFEVTLHALPDEPLVIGDNKDGTMAMRVAQWMTLPHKYQDAQIPGDGHLVTSTGERDAAAWGKRADWCDYHAPHDGKTYGVAIFDHPQNLRHPTWWMARDYGLFGANPFGQHDYENLKDQPHIGDYTLPAGGSLTLRYRFVFHYGDEQTAQLAERYRDYAAEK
jgi:hypothetical protein